MQTEIIKDTGYDSTETENTLYDEGYDGSVKKTNPEETNNTQKNSTPSHTTTKVSTTTTETNNENTEDVFEKYNLQCLKKELSEENIIHECRLFEKIPKHLSFIIQIQPKDHENPTELFHNIKQLIYWSIEVGIPYISFYDYNSFLKQHIKEIANTFDEEVHFPAAPEFSIKFNGSGDLVTARHLTNTYILNNNEKQKTFYSHFHVNFISYDDGKPQIAKVASLLSKTMKSSEVQCMTIEAMNEVISKYTFKNDGCDPELIIIYGGTPEYFQLYGYPPWQIRLSEIYYVPGKKDITYAGFINGLFRYSRCEQRVGK